MSFSSSRLSRSFWSLLSSGQDAITKVPISRWNSDNDWGGFLDRIDSFDPQFFNISPQEANNIDPQQRLLLEVSWEALENASLSAEKLAGSRSGVFVGISGGDYSRLSENFTDTPMYYVTGNALSIAANRLSYFLDWHGPSWAVDTACSSSLVAVHQACQSLLMGECNLALAGGVNLILSPQLTSTFSEAQMMATDGRCKTFDARADGYVRSEGCGVVVLKRLSDALTDGDNIQAIIKGSAVNQDGLTNGITAPNGTPQREVIRLALDRAGIEPNLISYVETHGTGTALGDPIEVNSLKAVLMEERKSDQPCWIGSVKTNIGHLEAAAGVAGLIKTVLSLEHGAIPPHLHFDRLNPYIKLDGTPIKIPTQLQRWVAGEYPRLAGVSAFGFGGTNAHIVLEEAPPQFKLPNIPSEDRNPIDYQHEALKNLPERPIHLLTLSAKCEKALQDLVFSYKNHLEKNEHLDIAAICCSAHVGRSHFSHRLAIVAANNQELINKLAKISLEEDRSIFIDKAHPNSNLKLLKMAFLFTGQGCQYINMGRQLYKTQPVFRRVINQCDRILRSYLEKSLLDVIYPENAQEELDISLIDQTAYTQPALFAVEYALCELWQSWGVKPAAVMGHSVGEYVAACVAGVFTLADGLKLIAARGRLMQSLPANGGMLAVFAGRSIVDSILADWSQDVVIAGFNGPDNYVLSGSEQALHQIERQLQIQGVKAVLLSVSHAFHSPLMEPMLAEFEQIAQTVTFQLPKLEVISNLTGGVVDREMSSSDYWVRHIREAVKFSQGMETLADRGYEIFIECGPKPILLGMGHKCLPKGASLWLPSLRSSVSDWQQLLESLGQLYVAGVKIDWQGFEHYYPKFSTLLPTYPFQRQSYWLPSTAKEEQYLAQKKWHPQDWFYQWSWQPEDLVKAGELPVDGIIILAHDSIDKKSLKQSLGDNLYFVILGEEFKQVSEREFVINSDCFADYVRVIETIQHDGGKLSTAIHLGNLSTTLKLQSRQEIELVQSLELQKSVFNVLSLIQALLQEAASCQRLLIVTQGAYLCNSSESLNSLYQAMGSVLVQSCSQEHNSIRGQIIDLPSGGIYEGASLAQLIAQELTAKPSAEGIVAIRQQQRLVRTLIPSLQTEPEELQSIAICEGDTWLITGGLSEVGQAIAKGLAAKAKINLVLTGRSLLPPRQDWAFQKQFAPMAQRFTTIEALERLGANVIYQVVDITNLEQMEHLMVTIKEQFGELNGVIQAAGILDTQSLNIQDKTPETFRSVLAPKVQGTLFLDWVTRAEPLKYFILLSSVTASGIEWSSGNLSDYQGNRTCFVTTTDI
jgi:acyl transferase domain-containing protein